MWSVLKQFFGSHQHHPMTDAQADNAAYDVETQGFPLVPDRSHLCHVGHTAQGNGYWITDQLVCDDAGTRDFIACYVFDPKGHLISSEVVDLGLRSQAGDNPVDVIGRLKRKIDARDTGQIWVKPFEVSYFGHCFGLIPRPFDETEDDSHDRVIDAMPGHTLMFYGPWSHCNYDS